MRIVVPRADLLVRSPRRTSAIRRSANVELLGLTLSTFIILAGLGLVYAGKTQSIGEVARDTAAGTPVNLRELRTPDALVPLLTMFENEFVRRTAAGLLYAR